MVGFAMLWFLFMAGRFLFSILSRVRSGADYVEDNTFQP